MNRLRFLLATLALGLALTSSAGAQNDAVPADPARERELRGRYESVLLKNPFQERAFNSVYDGFAKVEGVDQWLAVLRPKSDVTGEEQLPALLLLGQIYDRQFKTPEAITAFERAAALGEARPQFKVLLGTLYYKAGKDELAAKLLGESLETLTDLDQRSAVCRMLGNLYLRQGRRDQAIAVWKRIAEQNPEEVFAQLELAEIYEDNRMWPEAIGVYRQIADTAKDDPYRRCRALRNIGQCHLQAEQFKEAIATYEQALQLVAPGNWLFEDLKLRLVGVYEEIGDLEGLVKYVDARLQQNPNDTEFRDLLAETFMRLGKFPEASQQYRSILERNPRNSSIYEKLIALHARTGNKAEAVAAFEKLIELFPADTDYLRRLGEFHLHDQQPVRAKEAWHRVVKTPPEAAQLATLAGWFESYEFNDEAIATYQQALEKKPDKEWSGRLAALKFQKGEEAEAIKLWLGVITDQSKPEERAEIASILEANNKLDEALTLRRTAVEQAPTNLEGRLAYAKLLSRQKQYELALAEFEFLAAQDQNEFLQLQGEQGRLDAWRELGVLESKQKALEAEVIAHPNEAKQLGQLARLYEKAGQREKAIALYEGRREQEPDNVEYLRSLAGLYRAGKQTDQSIAIYRALLEKDKNRSRVYQKELLDIYLATDLKDEAIASGETYVSLAPGDPEAHLILAQVYQMYRQPEKGFNEYRTTLRLEPNEPDYHRQYGESLEQEKRYGDAQEAFRKMLDTSKEDPTRLAAVASLARIYLQQDRLPELVTEFQRRIKNTPKKLAAYEELAAIHRESGQIFRGVEVLESALQGVDDKAAALKALIRATYEAQDFPKVKSYYEQLVAMSGKPTANEFEKLGQIYEELGEIEKAKETWNKIIVAAPKDAKAHDRVARLLQEKGFTDEALGLKARAVELEPTDYKRRFEYAQLLAQSQQPVQAMEQIRLLLELGDRTETEAKEKESEKKVQRVQKGQTGPGAISPYQFLYSGRSSSRGRYYGGGWQGTFRQFRPAVLQFMASLAQQSIGEEAFLEQLTARTKKAPENLEVRRDLLTILRMFNRMEDALKLAQEILAVAPDDPETLPIAALLYSDQQQLDQAIPLLERLAKTQPQQRLATAPGLVALHFKNKQPEQAAALIETVLKENPTDPTAFYAMSQMLQQNARWDEARKVLTRLKEADPQQSDQVNGQLAAIAKQSGQLDAAFALYRQALFGEAKSPPALFARARRLEIYVPDPNPGASRNFSNPLQNMPPNALGNLPWQRSGAFNELKAAARSGADRDTNLFAAMEEASRRWSPAATPSQREQAWEMARLLTAHYVVEKEFDRATNLLAALRQAGLEEASWFNASIYVAQQREDFDAMIRYYDELQQRYPAKARDLAVARANTRLIAKQYDEVARSIRELNQQRVPPAQVLGLIGTLKDAGEKKLAKELLEEHLAGISRNPQALAMLASLYAEDNDFEKAIVLGNEAWERKAHGTGGAAAVGFSSYYSYYGMMRSSVDSLLSELHRYYVGAGRSDELLGRFKSIVEKQPGSVQAHENLASLYRLSDQRDKALEVYQQLTEKRPHLLQIRRQIASLYQEMGQFDQATRMYEDLIKANPALYNQLSWELRWAYQRQGKGKELATMEDKLSQQARDPNQLMQLANRMREEGELDKAIELIRKAAKMSPGQGYFQSQLASLLVEQGRLDEALQAYEQWFNSPQLRGQGFTDHMTLRQLAGLYQATGRMDGLKQRCTADLTKNPGDKTARALQAQIAFLEKRYDDALAGFKQTLAAGPDPNLIGQLIELAGFSGKFKEVLAVAESVDQSGAAWDSQQLASLYLAVGNPKKAATQQLKWAEDMIQQGNGSWALRETVEAFMRMDLPEEAERFVAKHRTDAMDQSEAEEFDRQIAQRYVNDGRFAAIVKEVLGKETLKGRDLQLAQKIVEQYQAINRNTERRQFLEKLVASDPKNRELSLALVQLYDRPEDVPQKRALAEKLIEADGNNVAFRRGWAEALIDSGQTDEAFKILNAWATEKPGEQRWSLLSDLNKRAGRLKEARAALVKAAESADKTRQNELRLQLASFDTQHGSPAGERDALRANFEKKKDAQSFQRYFGFLRQQGWDREAHGMLATNLDNGFFEQYQNTDFVALCLNQSDLQSPANLNWRFTRYGERWNRDFYFDQVAALYRQRGKFNWFVADFDRRIREDTTTNRGLWDKLARAWEQAGQPERAVAIYDQQLKQSPFNLIAQRRKADFLLKLGRTNEALELLRHPNGITSLEAESVAKLQLVRVLFQVGQREAARGEVTALLAWDKRPATLQAIGNLLMEQKDYTQAAELLEQASASLRDWNFDEVQASLAKCRAKLGRTENLAQVIENLSRGDNAEWRLNELQGWLTRESFSELAAKLIQTRLAKAPGNLDLQTALALSYLDAGQTNEAFSAMETAARNLPADRQAELRSRLGSILVERELLDEALRRQASGESPLLAGALVSVLTSIDEQSPRTGTLAEAAIRFHLDDAETQNTLAAAFARLKRNDEAANWYRRAFAATNETIRIAAAMGLARSTGDPSAVPVLMELLTRQPQRFLIQEEPIAAVAKTGDEKLTRQLDQALVAAALHESERDFGQMLLRYYAGHTNAARPVLLALVEAPGLSGPQLQTVARLCAEQGLTDGRVKALERLAAGGYGGNLRSQALCELVETHARAANFGPAVEALSQTLGVWGMDYAIKAQEALADSVTATSFPQFRTAVLGVASQRSGEDVVPVLLGLCRQVAQRFDLEQSGAGLAEEANLSSAQRAESAAWDGLIEDWEIAGPLRTAGADTANRQIFYYNGEETGIAAASETEPSLPARVTWKKTDPKRELGLIRVARVLGLGRGAGTGQFAYARTTLVSPDERRVTFCLGSDDWVKVWINGELVDSQAQGRSLYPDQDRFTLTLKPGENRVLMKVGNFTDSWGLCLRISEGGDGVKVATRN